MWRQIVYFFYQELHEHQRSAKCLAVRLNQQPTWVMLHTVQQNVYFYKLNDVFRKIQVDFWVADEKAKI